MYVCGVTPYDEVHLGHARAYVTFDIIRRHLEHSGYNVKYIQNFTDVDDKIINRAAQRNISPSKLAEIYIKDYFHPDGQAKHQTRRRLPQSHKDHSGDNKIHRNADRKRRGLPVKSGDVYFAVKKFPRYGKLSKRKLEELKIGARVESAKKRTTRSISRSGKPRNPTSPRKSCWHSPWGKGRPGWHIECSVMSTNALGATIDIHGGGPGPDFPHHENEIAQSEAATGKPFAKYWIHNGFVTVNREKMSKSLGNFFTLREIFEKYPPRVVRYFLLSQHYKSPLDFSDERLKGRGKRARRHRRGPA